MSTNSFIVDFIKYNEGNECPKPYVTWTAYGLLSAAIGRKLFLDLDYFFVRCDTYILLVGPSGGRKTVSMVLGLELLREAIPDLVVSSDNETYQGIISYVHNENSTREYIDEKGVLVKYKPYHIFSEELMDYLQLNPVAMVTFLTNIYGKKGYIYRLKNEEHVLENPYITMCACSVPEWLTDQVKAKQFSEGYGRRTIIVCHSGIVRKKPVLTDESRAARQRCLERLHKLKGFAGPAQMSEETKAYFWGWYTALKDPDDHFLKNWYSTKHLNVLKIAMLSSISERDDLVVTTDHIKLSIALLDEIEHQLPMITDRIGRSEVVPATYIVLELLRNHGGEMPEKDLRMKTLKDFRNTMEQFSVLTFMQTTGQIAVEGRVKDGITKKFIVLQKKD